MKLLFTRNLLIHQKSLDFDSNMKSTEVHGFRQDFLMSNCHEILNDHKKSETNALPEKKHIPPLSPVVISTFPLGIDIPVIHLWKEWHYWLRDVNENWKAIFRMRSSCEAQHSVFWLFNQVFDGYGNRNKSRWFFNNIIIKKKRTK